ncbi:glutamate racemase [Gemella sp. GH3]|uniref:glutamate racemase n=1 Tax=unclassified Gemella TaxID=2624949 RepID=UPI0015D0071E|nr:MULTISPECIES: glutamate racemase [unclassified Gemella]MBF0713183.1 glutamate racemase [Gemella sp. GH3.1]NYS50135.1 glutamate racemase [Gemella sp. GH3]
MNKPIGIFDSGVGGLTVAREILKKLPNETIYFFGDVENCPYGEKTQTEIINYTEKAINFLIKKDVKIIILACNTATAAALEFLKYKYDIPIIGVIKSGATTALETTINKRILVLGTNFTINSKAYSKVISNIDENTIVYEKSCPSFVPFIENNDYNNEDKAFQVIDNELAVTKDYDMDTLILGCTHYPIIQNYIEKYYDNKIKVISSAVETTKKVYNILKDNNMLNNKKTNNHKFFISKESTEFEITANKWLNENIDLEVVK